MSNNNKTEFQSDFLFNKKNYYFMGAGVFLIALGFLLMTGYDANTMPDGTPNPDYWNQNIFSWVRIRMSPFLVLLGFVTVGYSIMLKPKA